MRQGEVETIEYNRDKGIGVSVFLGQKRGNASTSDFSTKSIRDTVDAALSIARYTASDDCAGLPEQKMLATEFPDFDLYHPWALSVEQAIEFARECEQAAFARDKRINNSEGASVNMHEAQFVYANSLGFIGGFPTSRHSISCAVIAGKNDAMQRDYWYSEARNAREILKVEEIGRIAAERAVRRLNSRKLGTMQVPVLYEAPVAASLIGHFVGAVSGGSLYRKSSFLLDQLGKPYFRKISTLTIYRTSQRISQRSIRRRRRENPAPAIVENGVLQGYFLGSVFGTQTRHEIDGKPGGNHNLILPGNWICQYSKKMGRGLVVTELLGRGQSQ